jgi:hypothetical protein
MAQPILHEHYLNPLLDMLDEVFENHHGYILDKGTSLFETLASISAEQASIPVGGKCASLAAQVAHITYYIELLEQIILTRQYPQADWGEIWRTVGKVTPEEWDDLREKLKAAYRRIVELLRANPAWDADSIGGTLGILAHTAYHLGEIRQALCTLR